MKHRRKLPNSDTKAVRILSVIVSLVFIAAIMEASVFAVSITEAGAGPEVITPKAAPNLAVMLSTDGEYPHTSLLFTVADVVFFSYEDGTMLELYNSSNALIWNNGGLPLDKGGHAHVSVSQGVYRARGSNKFSVLSGDPITRYVCGYYAMDQNGFGASKELYTWVPQLYSHCKFIVFAYEDNTNVTVEYTDTGVDIAVLTLNKGQHWDIETLSSKWLHITADKPVSALTCYDQGYFVPSATGRWSGTEFYTYVSDIAGWSEDLTVIAYEDGTQVTITDTDTSTLVWSGTLNSGKAHVEQYPGGANKYFAITSSKNVTVCVLPWVSWTNNYHQGAYIQDREGAAGIGTDLIGSTLNGGYMYILAYADNTNIDIFNSQTGVHVASGVLNEGESVEANPGNGLWRIISSDFVSAYSGWGQWNAEFAPVEFADVLQKRVFIDIKPQSCPNPLNMKSKGVVPVAILGTDELDVKQIDPATIVLGREGIEVGVELLRWAYEDVATPFEGELCDCHTLGADGYLDLTVKFSTAELAALAEELGLIEGETIPLTLTGNLLEEFGGSAIRGDDCMRILKEKGPQN